MTIQYGPLWPYNGTSGKDDKGTGGGIGVGMVCQQCSHGQKALHDSSNNTYHHGEGPEQGYYMESKKFLLICKCSATKANFEVLVKFRFR